MEKEKCKQITQTQIKVQPLNSCVTLGKFLNLAVFVGLTHRIAMLNDLMGGGLCTIHKLSIDYNK